MRLVLIIGYMYTFLIFLIFFLGYTEIFGDIEYSGSWANAPYITKFVVSIALPVFFVTWLVMLADFFKRKDIKHPVLTGIFLLLLNWLSTLLYFWFVVWKREKSNKQ